MPSKTMTAEQLAAMVLPVDGRADPERLALALDTVDEVLHAVSHATLKTTSPALASPAGAYPVLGSACEIAARLLQFYAQLGTWAASLSDDPALHSGGRRDREGGAAMALELAGELLEACNAAGTMKEHLKTAHSLLGRLYLEE